MLDSYHVIAKFAGKNPDHANVAPENWKHAGVDKLIQLLQMRLQSRFSPLPKIIY
ncbi:hypothetical protein SPM24T3_23949 [Serratia sp. M24T3]|nr:hypothetical protein SPM24T3_23949 [Serratia sp. M24T3]